MHSNKCTKVLDLKRNRNLICGLEASFQDLNINNCNGNEPLISETSSKLILEPSKKDEIHAYSRLVCAKVFSLTKVKTAVPFPLIKDCKVVIQKHTYPLNFKLRKKINQTKIVKEIFIVTLTMENVNNALSVLNTLPKDEKGTYRPIERVTSRIAKKGRKVIGDKISKTFRYISKPFVLGTVAKSLKYHQPYIKSNASCEPRLNSVPHTKFTRLNKPDDNPTKFRLIPCDLPSCFGEIECQPYREPYDPEWTKGQNCLGLDHCALGCVCRTLQNSGKYRLKNHCNNYMCGLRCHCGFTTTTTHKRKLAFANGATHFCLEEKRNRKLPLALRDNSFILHPHIKISRGSRIRNSIQSDIKASLEPLTADVLPCSVLIQNLYDPLSSLIMTR